MFPNDFLSCNKGKKGGGFMPTSKVQGKIYHRVGTLLPTSGADPQFLKIYFMRDAANRG
jgi:hypothetical protein